MHHRLHLCIITALLVPASPLWAAECVVTVSQGGASANGSLPQAASQSNCTTITFDVTAPVVLTSTVSIGGNVLVDGDMNGTPVTIQGATALAGKPLLKLKNSGTTLTNLTLVNPNGLGVQITGSANQIMECAITGAKIGVLVTGGLKNFISETLFSGVEIKAIRLDAGGNEDLPAPQIFTARMTSPATWKLSGPVDVETVSVEVYEHDSAVPTVPQGKRLVGTASAQNGKFSLEEIALADFSPDAQYTAIAHDGVNNTSPFAALFQPSSDPDFLCDFAWDSDGDGVDDAYDNCLDLANADQTDTDLDGFGDLCDVVINAVPTLGPVGASPAGGGLTEEAEDLADGKIEAQGNDTSDAVPPADKPTTPTQPLADVSTPADGGGCSLLPRR